MLGDKMFLVMSDDARSEDVRRWFPDDRFTVVDKPIKADRIVVVGGDGRMLSAINKYWRYNIPFLGIHRGTLGFLLNPVADANQFEMLLRKDNFEIVSLRLLKVTFFNGAGKVKQFLAFNDVYLNAASGTEMQGKIHGTRYPEKAFRGDGIIIATAQGSTAYNRNAGGSILPLDSDHFSIRTICASAATISIRDLINPQKLEIEITRGKVIGHADTKRNEAIGVVRAVIEQSTVAVRLEFDPNYNFEARRYL